MPWPWSVEGSTSRPPTEGSRAGALPQVVRRLHRRMRSFFGRPDFATLLPKGAFSTTEGNRERRRHHTRPDVRRRARPHGAAVATRNGAGGSDFPPAPRLTPVPGAPR